MFMADTLAQEGKWPESAPDGAENPPQRVRWVGSDSTRARGNQGPKVCSWPFVQRKRCVELVCSLRRHKNNLKIILTQKGESNDTPDAPASGSLLKVRAAV